MGSAMQVQSGKVDAGPSRQGPQASPLKAAGVCCMLSKTCPSSFTRPNRRKKQFMQKKSALRRFFHPKPTGLVHAYLATTRIISRHLFE